MKKSEKIIVSLVVVAALYGATDFFLGKMAKQTDLPTTQQVDLSSITNKIAALSTGQNSKEVQLTKNLRQPWAKNIFFSKHPNELNSGERKVLKGEEMLEFAQETESFIYSGYLEMDNSRIAIINGLDYREGEIVDGFVIDKIRKKIVQLSRQGFLFNITATNSEDAGSIID